MKVFVIEPYTRSPGHFERLAVRTCEAFARLENEVTLVTYGGISETYPKETLLFALADAAPPGAKELNTRLHKGKLDSAPFRFFLKRMLAELRTFRLAASLLQQERAGVAHFYDADPVLLSIAMVLIFPAARKSRGVVTLMTVHEDGMLYPPQVVKIRRILYRWVFRWCLERLIKHNLDGVVVLDPALKEKLLTRLKISPTIAERIRVLPHGIGDPVEISSKEGARSRLEIDLKETIFLIFGILRKDKRIDLAMEAIKDLPRCRLVIAGGEDNFTAATVKELIRTFGCEQSVSTEIGYIPEQRMHDYFSACDAVVIPYGKSFKGWSGILALAAGHGRTVIASDVGIVGETVKEHKLGLVVKPDSTSELRKAMLRFLALTPGERAAMEQQVRCYANQQSWDVACEQWIELYRSLLNQPK